MTSIDPNAGRKAVEARLATTTNERHRTMLQTVADHLAAEAGGTVEGLLATLVPEPQYKMWANGSDHGPKGLAAVKAYYEALVASRRGHLEYALDRIVVDDDAVVTEGYITAYQPGRAAKEFGFKVDQVDATYLVVYRAIIIWPFDADARMIGEEGYATWNAESAVVVPSEELPEAYVELFDPSEYATVGIAAR
jgi:hypothetical protein